MLPIESLVELFQIDPLLRCIDLEAPFQHARLKAFDSTQQFSQRYSTVIVFVYTKESAKEQLNAEVWNWSGSNKI